MPEAAAAGCQVFWAACDELSQAFPLLPLLEVLDSRPRRPGAAASPDQQPAARRAAGRQPGRRHRRRGRASSSRSSTTCARRRRSCWSSTTSSGPIRRRVMTVGPAGPRPSAPVPLLLVATGRPVPRREDIVALRRARRPGSVVSLRQPRRRRGRPSSSATLVGGAPGPRLLKLAEGAAGNPLYLTELVDALVRGRRARRRRRGRRGHRRPHARFAGRRDHRPARVPRPRRPRGAARRRAARASTSPSPSWPSSPAGGRPTCCRSSTRPSWPASCWRTAPSWRSGIR